jgi:membrane associated rhomboid family serine protease
MQIESSDPAFPRPAEAREHFRLAATLALGFVAVLWLVFLLGWDLDLQRFGVRPRQWIGLPGILFAPLLHADFAHLVANSLPLFIVGTAMLQLYPTGALRALPVIYAGPGVAVWLFARGGVHIGASGLVYGLVGYVFVSGLIRRERRAIAAALLVAFLYGALVWGVLPIRHGVSWETHLAAALIGVALAVALRHEDKAPPRRYSWEDEAEEGGDAASPEYGAGEPADVPPDGETGPKPP